MIVAPIASARLAFGLMAFGFESPFLGAATGFGRTSLPFGLQGLLQPLSQPSESNVAIATLGSALIYGDANPRAKHRGQSLTLVIREGAALVDFENQFGSGVRSIGVLPAGASRRTETPLEFIVGNREVGNNLQRHAILPLSEAASGGCVGCAGTLRMPNLE